MFLLFASTAGAEMIIGAQYATPVARYGSKGFAGAVF